MFTFQEQQRRQTFGAPGCGTLVGTALLPARRGRLALALRTGHSRQAVRLYPDAGTPSTYRLGLDVVGETQAFVPGLGAVLDYDIALKYFRRAAGSPLTCGPAANYATLLPTRTVQAAAFAVFPNPAGAAATVAVAAPVQPGTRLALRDALGRTVWETALAPGQVRATVPLAGQPAGLYLVQLEASGAAPVAQRIVKE